MRSRRCIVVKVKNVIGLIRRSMQKGYNKLNLKRYGVKYEKDILINGYIRISGERNHISIGKKCNINSSPLSNPTAGGMGNFLNTRGGGI